MALKLYDKRAQIQSHVDGMNEDLRTQTVMTPKAREKLLEWEVEALNQTSSWYRDQWKLERSKRRWAGATKLGSLLVIVACTFLVGYALGKAGIWVAEFWTWFEFTVRSW